MRLIAACALLIFATSCPSSSDGTPDGGAGGTGGMGGISGMGGMGASCPVFFYTESGCSDDVMGRCFPNHGGACPGGYCGCDGRIKFDYCTGTGERFAYRIPWTQASGREGQACDPKADAPPP
jgi:hypothetical protein